MKQTKKLLQCSDVVFILALMRSFSLEFSPQVCREKQMQLPSPLLVERTKKHLLLGCLLSHNTVSLPQSLQNVIDSIPLLDQELKINS